MDLKKTYIIAEAGINHNGNFNTAKKLITEAKLSGANAIKFQTFLPDAVATKALGMASYQKRNLKKKIKMVDMIKNYALSLKYQKKFYKFEKKKKIDFISSAFDLESLDFLINDLKLKILKIPSGEITNYPYLKRLSKINKKIILSTGMSNMNEIKQALKVLLSGKLKRKNISILHCNTDYPTPMKDVNLNAILSMKRDLKLNIGYSDHTIGTEVSIAAVCLGAKIIEKHITLNKLDKGPDHKSSLSINELKSLISAIRNIEKSFGSDIKKVSPSEKKNIKFARKVLVAKKFIKKGEKFSISNITTKRAGKGLSPMNWNKYISKKSTKNFREDEKIK